MITGRLHIRGPEVTNAKAKRVGSPYARGDPHILIASTERDFDAVFENLIQLRADGLVIAADPLFSIHMPPGHRIVPMLARVRPGFALRLNRDEVDNAFEAPFALWMTPQNYKRESRDWNGLTLSYYVMPFGDRKIWRATAFILRNLYERLYRE